jgi:thymidylate synthase ThyX
MNMPVDKPTKKAPLLQPSNTTKPRIYWMNKIRTKREDGSPVELTPTPEQLAVAFAKCSRSSTPFDQNVDDVDLEKAAAFHEKWVVGYGHGSVAEHAVASVAMENIPQVVVKIVEDSRLCSYTEKSSRYQVFTRDRVAVPTTLENSTYMAPVNQLFDRLYNLYDDCYQLLEPLMMERNPQGTLSDGAYKAVLKALVCDRVRYLLPSASLTMVGMTANARNWGFAITKLLSTNDSIAQDVGNQIKESLRGADGTNSDEALQKYPLPTLLKYADPNQYQINMPKTMAVLANQILSKDSLGDSATDRRVICTYDDVNAERRIAASLLSLHGKISMAQALDILAHQPQMTEVIIAEAMKERGDHDPAPRAFEHAWFQHQIVMDYGGWRDIQRHRMCTQSNQPLGTDLGYDIPVEIEEIGKEKDYTAVMDMARDLNHKLLDAGMATEAEYVVPMAYRRRLVVSWNVRELFHFIELRSGKKGHPSYRKVAQDLWHNLNETHPLIASYIRVDLSETGISTLGEKPKGF